MSQIPKRMSGEPPANPIARHALFIERITGPLNDLTPLMGTLGYRVARASDPEAITKFVRTLQRLSVVVMNCDTLKADCGTLVTAIKSQHPDLPIAALTKSPNSGLLPPATFAFVTGNLQAMQDWLASRVRGEVYSAELVKQLLGDFQTLLSNFSLPTRPSEPCLKSSLTQLKEVNAFVSFGGEGVSGHLILRASADDMAAAYRACIRRTRFPGHEDLEDLLGEVANQALGQVKRAIGAEDSRSGLPYFVRGNGTTLRHKAGAPSLDFEFTQREAKLQIELCIHRLDGAVIQVGESSQMQSGELRVF
ncbi:MAG TPA: chemotaxis protein CheX [Polyangiaceae bacterium]